MIKKTLLAGLVAAITSVSAQAGNFYIDLGGTYYEYDNDSFLEQEAGGNINLGYDFGENVALELGYTRVDTTYVNDYSRDLTTVDPRIGGLVYFGGSEKFRPFLYVGMGNFTVEKDLNQKYDNDFNVQGGFGVKAYMSDNFYARLDARAIHIDTNYDHYATTLAIGWRFGDAPSKSVAPIVTQPEPTPEPEPVIADADNDGIEDSADNCSNTPPGVSVDAQGCPIDSDKDGIADYQDNCPGTDLKLKVDSKGCAVVLKEAVSIDLSVEFGSNSSVVEPGYYGEIAKVARFLEQYAGTNVVIEGHTDSQGSAAYNKQLSQKRADAVADILVVHYRIDPTRVRAVGYGEESPIADDSTAEGRAANRRVVAVVKAVKESFQNRQ